MLRIAARKGMEGKPIKIVWWDPTVEALPVPKHGDEVDPNMIRIFLSPHLRVRKPGLLSFADYSDSLSEQFRGETLVTIRHNIVQTSIIKRATRVLKWGF